jgi:hypothetical protein
VSGAGSLPHVGSAARYRGRVELRADCSRCVGICCVAPAFQRSSDFAIDKPAGTPCPHLGGGQRCGIHTELRGRGFPGCDVFDCFGAGQRVVQGTFGGHAELGPELFAVFGVVRQLHEFLWYLDDALTRPRAAELHADVSAARRDVATLAAGAPRDLRDLDLDDAGHRTDVLLRRASELHRAGHPARARRRDLAGARLRGRDLRGQDLRGALLLGADLRDADLRDSDLIGADLRGADLRGADLTGALYLTTPQVRSARGDERTRLPDRPERPAHWGGAAGATARDLRSSHTSSSAAGRGRDR